MSVEGREVFAPCPTCFYNFNEPSPDYKSLRDALGNLFARIRPDCEVAPWVYAELRTLLAQPAAGTPTTKEES